MNLFLSIPRTAQQYITITIYINIVVFIFIEVKKDIAIDIYIYIYIYMSNSHFLLQYCKPGYASFHQNFPV